MQRVSLRRAEERVKGGVLFREREHPLWKPQRSAHLVEVHLIIVYRGTHQCGERSNAAFGRQSAAEVTSHAPHDSKARLLDVSKRRDSWRSHVHRTRLRSACSYSSCKLPMLGVEGGSPRPSLGDLKGVFSSRREYPLCPASPQQVGTPIQRPRRCKTHAPLLGAKKGALYGTYNESHCQNPL